MSDTGDHTSRNEESDGWFGAAMNCFDLASWAVEKDREVLVKECTAQGLDRLSNIDDLQETTA